MASTLVRSEPGAEPSLTMAGQGGPASVSLEQELRAVIGQVLAQYQEPLAHQIEKEILGRLLVLVREQARTMHGQAQERLRSADGDLHRRLHGAMDRTQERVLAIVREEVEALYGELEGRLRGLLPGMSAGQAVAATAPPEATEPPVPDEDTEQASTSELLAEPKAEEEAAAAGTRAARLEVHLELPPPLEIGPLMAFYRGLSDCKKELRVLRTLGSVHTGVSVYIRQQRPAHLLDLLRRIPAVREAYQEAPGDGARDGMGPVDSGGAAYRILLRAAGE